jgi:hypothetical protein
MRPWSWAGVSLVGILLMSGLWLGWGEGLILKPAPVKVEGPVCSEAFAPIAAPRLPDAAREEPQQRPAATAALRLPAPPRHLPRLAFDPELARMVQKYAQAHGVDEDLVWAVMRAESGFNPRALSPKGAMGLMQLMPGTAVLVGVTDPFDMEQNIAGGVKYLERCLNQFNRDVSLALAAYNAGPHNVVKYGGIPPFSETIHYVAAILGEYLGLTPPRSFRPAALRYLDTDDLPSPPKYMGLPWRVPLPRWKVAEPKYKLTPPRWKVSWQPG